MQLTIDRAINILTDLKYNGLTAGDYASEDAIDLGIEALKRVLSTRVEPRYSSVDPLPGETDA